MSKDVTDVVFIPIRPTGKGMIGFASFTYHNAMHFGSVAVYMKRDGSMTRCVFPTKKLPNGASMELFKPINKEAYDKINEAIWEVVAERIREQADAY